MVENLRHVRAFLAVARWRSFTRAAHDLHVSQPALTVQIQQLETALGARLFERDRRIVSLTPAGRDLHRPLQRLVSDAEALVVRGGSAEAGVGGVVSVAAVPSLAATLMPGVILEFGREYPGVVVRVKDSVGNLMDLVKSGDVAFGIGGELQRDRQVAVESLYTEPMCVFAPMAHPLAAHRVVTLAEIVPHRAILPTAGSSLRAILDRACAAQRLQLHAAHEFTNMSTAVSMVSAGLGYTILPKRASDSFVSSSVRCVDLYKPTIERTVVVALRAGDQLSVPAQRLLDILRRRTRPASAATASSAPVPARRPPAARGTKRGSRRE